MGLDDDKRIGSPTQAAAKTNNTQYVAKKLAQEVVENPFSPKVIKYHDFIAFFMINIIQENNDDDKCFDTRILVSEEMSFSSGSCQFNAAAGQTNSENVGISTNSVRDPVKNPAQLKVKSF